MTDSIKDDDLKVYRGFDSEVNDNILHLARTISRINTNASTGTVPGVLPILQTDDSRLDPNSPDFDLKFWVRNARKIMDSDPRYKMPSLGASYKDLRVTGEGGLDVDFQLNMINVFSKYINIYLRKYGVLKSETFDILKPMDGICNPGELTVVLGRPGAGCSTLLKTLTGHTYGFNVDEQSDLSYDGLTMHDINKTYRGEVAYCAETETHFPHLTVGQTLEFALKMRTPQTRPDGVDRELYAKHITDVYMATFGLSHTRNTKVGDDFVRGVSGGERKRVSITEVAISQAPFQCWDNSTRGLDSATALEFINALKTTADVFRFTPMVAIYQCSQDAYNLFDRAILLYEGYQIYNGPASTARRYFENLGFYCPDRQVLADFLTSLTNPSERVAKKGWENKVPNTPEEFYNCWQKSDERKNLLNEIDERRAEINVTEMIKESHVARQSNHTKAVNPYMISFPMQIRYCVERSLQRMMGAPLITLFQIFGNFFISIIVSSIFYDLPLRTSYIYNRATSIFFAVLFNCFFSLLELFQMYEARPIVEKHKLYALYRPSAEALASIMTEFPVKICTSLFFNIPWYFMIHFKYNAGNFFFYMLINFFSTLCMSHMFRSIGSATRTLSEAMTPASLLLLALTVYTGFIVPTPDMLGWSRWINYINPVAYSFEATMANEFTGRKFECDAFVPRGPGYPTASDTGFHRICNSIGAVPDQNYVDGDVYMYSAYRYKFDHRWRNFGILLGFVITFLIVHLIIAEYQKGIRLKGEVLLFQQKFRFMKHKKKLNDIEANTKKDFNVQRELENDKGVSASESTNSSLKPIQEYENNVDSSGKPIFHFRDITYEVQIKTETRTILNRVDGYVKPGQVTALMGASGAGKTTLLNALSDRLTSGVITSGTRMINGRPLDASFQRSIGYVQQQDLHLSTSTVREALTFAADLRQPASTPVEEKREYVNYVIDLLEMEKYADAVVGVPGEGLNVEQRKRLTIGVELAAKPKLLLFLDEPTSGLDSQTAWSICKLIRKLADSGQAILCTIHQPSAILLQTFDKLLFLQRGGQTVYFGDLGDNFSTLIQYFEANSSLKCPSDANPAEWMLKVIGAAPGSHAEKDFYECWRSSPEYKAVQDELDVMERELVKREKVTTKEDMESFATPLWYQYLKVTRRVLEQYWRTPYYLYSKIFLSALSCLFNGFTFFHAKKSIAGLQNQMFSAFMFLILFGPLCFQYLPHYVAQRSLYEVRERPLKTFSWVAFIAAQITAELPWQILTGTLAFFCWYYPVGFYNNAAETGQTNQRGAFLWFLVSLFFMYISTYSQLCISFLESDINAANLALIGFSLCLAFCGVLITKERLPGFWIFMYRVSPFTYLVSAILLTALANSLVTCAENEILLFHPYSDTTCATYMAPFMKVAGGYLLQSGTLDGEELCHYCPASSTNGFLGSIGANFHQRGRNAGIFIAFIIINAVGTISFYYMARVPKGDRLLESHGPFRKVTAFLKSKGHELHQKYIERKKQHEASQEK